MLLRGLTTEITTIKEYGMIFEKKKDPDLSIDSNLRQKSGTYENVVNRLVSSLAMMPKTFYSKREGAMASWRATNERKSVKRNKF